MMVVITLHYEEDCRSRFYTSHIYTAGGTDKLIDGFWTENGRGIAHPQKIARKYQAIYAQNCNYPYDPENDWRGPDIRNGKVMKKSMGPDFFYVDKAGNMVTALTRAEEWNFDKVEALGVEHVYGFGPTLVQKGVLIDEKHMRTSGVYGNNPRSAFGSVEIGHYVGIVVDGRKPGVSVGVNLTRLGEQFLKIGCTEAYNLDGGQSSCMLFMGEMVTNHNGESMFNGQRILPDMLIWGTSDLSLSLE